ncbi:MAG: multicopper oxidase family protein [Gemmatimonadota bacterium]
MLLTFVLALAATRRSFAQPAPAISGCEARQQVGQPAPDLHCIELLPSARAPDASGIVRMTPAPSPFGVSVDVRGVHRWSLALEAEGLPDPESLGPYGTFVAWATTPLLRPVIRLGEVGDGRMELGPVALDKFLILVTAEASPGVEEPEGPRVLRGTSPSMALQPHELPALLGPAVGAESDDDADGHAHGDDGEGWEPPPMHPGVTMVPGMHTARPDVAPWLPPWDPATLPGARPRQAVRLADGDSLELTAAPVRRTIGGRTLALLGFNGQIPGPLLLVPEAATVTVRFTNRIDRPTTVHWHGIRLDNRFDGVPFVTQEPVPPGGTFVYEVRFPDPGLYWYHPHHREDVTQDLGLYGNILVRSEEGYGPADREELLVLDDLLLDAGGLPVPWGEETATHALMGRFGNVFLVNGEPDYRLEVGPRSLVRFLLTDVSSTRTYNLSFGAPTKVVAADLGRFEREEIVESVVIGPAERYVVDVRYDEPGTYPILNRVRGIDMVYGNYLAETDTLGIVEVTGDLPPGRHADSFRLLREPPDVGAEIARFRALAEGPVDRELVLAVETEGLPFPLGILLRLERAYFNPLEWSGTMPVMNWATTARQVRWVLRDPETDDENMEIEWRFRVGDVVRIRITNSREAFHAMQHPIHLHGQRFLVVARNGVPNDNLVWKDTLIVPAGQTADLLVEMSNPGRWMLHCHIAEHLEAGMKTVVTVE